MSELEPLTLDVLRESVRGTAAAFRCRTRLQPAGGPGTKVFPPTYAGAVYAVEQRRLPGREEPVTCVLLDSVQSQANRMEEALQDAVDEGRIRIPLIEVDFREFYPGDDKPEELRLLDPVGRVTSLQAPHRLADAILRDSYFNGKPFRQSDLGREIDRANVQNATPLYRLCPTALVFGMWDSTGPKGGLGAKFERAMVSEIVGIGCCYRYDGTDKPPKNMGIRRDPLNISKAIPLTKTEDGWELVNGTGKTKTIRPSEINHSNVPFDTDNAGVTVEYAEQTTVVSLPVLRRLRFPQNGNWEPTDEQHQRDQAARTVLAALALCAAELAAEKGLGLRSRCLLWPDELRTWELLAEPGAEPRRFSLGAERAIELLKQAVEQARAAGLDWIEEPVTLQPSEKLVKLLVRSQEQLAKLEGTEEVA